MQTYRTEGIILHAFKFRDYDQILTVFTGEEGVIKLFVKGAFSNKNGKGTMTAPLSLAEFVYSKGSSELYPCKEISMIDQHLNLRQNIHLLEAASEIVQILYASQMPHKPAPDLYKLLLHYLQKMTAVPDPKILAASYRLKMLRYEGLFTLGSACTACGEELKSHFFSAGESYCRTHAPVHSFEFSQEEIPLLEKLTYSKWISHMSDVTINPDFYHRLKLLFSDLIK